VQPSDESSSEHSAIDEVAARTKVDWASLAIHSIAVLSGVAALIYEVTWTRRLTFVFGATIRAVSAVLAAYMAGLAAGAWIAAKRPTRSSAALVRYAWIEAGIAVAGALVPSVIDAVRTVDSSLYDNGAATQKLTALRVLLALMVVGAPAALMGATFPLLAARLRREQSATLYAANTLGAVIGTFFSGFYAIGAFGVRGTERAAIALNLTAALCALLVHRRFSAASNEHATHEPSRDERPAIAPSLAVAATLFSGAACIASEVLWSRALAFRFSWLNNTTYTFPAMLGVVLAGMCLGSLAASPLIARVKRPGFLYATLVALAGASVALSSLVAVTHGGAPFGTPLDLAEQLIVRRAIANVLAESAAVVLLPSLLFGAAFPAAIRASTDGDPARSSAQIAKLYAASTAGAIVGSLLAAFVIVPTVGIARGVLWVGIALALAGVALFYRDSSSSFRARVLSTALLIALLVACGWRLPKRPQLTADNAPVVFYEEGPTATVTVARAHDGFLRIDVDGVPVAGTSPTMLTDQKSLAHIPMMLVERPTRALTVGFGSGGTSHSLSLHPRLSAVHAVEIAPEMLHGAPFLTASNHGLLSRRDPRYRVVLDDARSYLAHTNSTYDTIATDCTDLRYRSNANLYDVEYFRFTRARLAPGGLVAVWLPVGGLSRYTFKIALKTFGAVFDDFVVSWPNGFPSHYVVLLGWRDRREVRWDRMVSLLGDERIAADLREIALADPAKILSTYLADGASLRAALADVPVNTEDRPVLEFEAPLQGYERSATVDNLRFLWDHRVDATALVSDRVPDDQRARLATMSRAMDMVIAAHGASFAGETHRAAQLYLEALAIAPTDRSVRDRAREMVDELRGREAEPAVALTLCRAEQLLSDRARAIECYARLSRSRDESIASAAARWSAELREQH
jgi:spermidine synthase